MSNNAPVSLALGSTVVAWKATDNAGLSSACVQTVIVNAVVVDPISITTAQCTIVTPTSGLWNIGGTSAFSNNNTIQLFTTAVVPAPLTSNLLGAPTPVVAGGWKFKPVTGPACVSPISLRGSVSGTVKNNIIVAIK